MYVLAGLLTAFIFIPWLFICLTPMVLLVGSIFVVSSGLIKLISKIDLFHDESVSGHVKVRKVLVVDDDFASVLPLIGLLENSQAEVNFVSSGIEMIQELKTGTYDLVFLDSKMPNMDGHLSLEMGDKVLKLQRKQPVIFYSSYAPQLEVLTELKHFDVRDAWKKADLDVLKKNVVDLLATPSKVVA